MLFGRVLKQGAPFTFNEDILDNPEIAEVGAVLAIHNIALAPENLSQTSLWVKKDDQEFLIATLSKEHSHASIDLHLFIQDDSELFVKGNGSIHVIGSFELDEEPFDSENLYGGEGDSEEEDDEDDDEEEAAPKKAEVPKSQVLKHVGAADKKSPAVAQSAGSKATPAAKAQSPSGSPKPNAKPHVPVQVADEDSDIDDDDDDVDEDSLIDDDDIDGDLEDIDDSIDDDEDEAPVHPVKQAKVAPQGQGKKPFVPNQNKGGFQGGNQNKPNQNNNKPFNKGPGGQQGNKGGFQGKNNQNKGKPFKKN